VWSFRWTAAIRLGLYGATRRKDAADGALALVRFRSLQLAIEFAGCQQAIDPALNPVQAILDMVDADPDLGLALVRLCTLESP